MNDYAQEFMTFTICEAKASSRYSFQHTIRWHASVLRNL